MNDKMCEGEFTARTSLHTDATPKPILLMSGRAVATVTA